MPGMPPPNNDPPPFRLPLTPFTQRDIETPGSDAQDWYRVDESIAGQPRPFPEPSPTHTVTPEVARRSSMLRKLGPGLPERIAHYLVLDELGRGGMGVVYLAMDRRLHREVALKMIHGGSTASGHQRTRFNTEAETAARLEHPGVVRVYEVGEWEGQPYLAMEYVDGPSLQTLLDGKPQPPRQAAEQIIALADAMHYAHQHGVIHRDLKPANILQSSSGALKITDFGLAKSLGSLDQHTRTGDVVGTPQYMAPEQTSVGEAKMGPAADVYSLGVLLYEMLTGRPPFRGATPLETILQVRTQDPVPPRRFQPNVPADLETICLKCLSKEPPKRYASAAALAEDLRRFLANQPIQARPVGKLESAWKWVRRHPTLTGLIVVSCLAVGALVAIGLVSLTNMALQAQLERAATQRHQADGQRVLAQVQRFEQMADDHVDILEHTLDRNVQVLHSLSNFYAASESVNRTEFRIFTVRALQRNRFIRALQWVPRVPHGEARRWEEGLRAEGIDNHRLQEVNDQGQLVPAVARTEHFPVHYIQAQSGFQGILGFDHAADPHRRDAMRRAMETGLPIATEITTIYSSSGPPEKGFLIFMPIFQSGAQPLTPAQRREQLSGFVVAVCSLRDVIDQVFQRVINQNLIDLQIWDTTDPAHTTLIYPLANRKPVSAAVAVEQGWEQTIDVSGRTWRIMCRRPVQLP